METPLLEMKNITKEFPGVKALSNVSFRVAAGEIHCLVGENGAGKSTLMKVLSGVYPHGNYSGQILINDRALENYFPDVLQQRPVNAPLQAADLLGKLDCFANVQGGGISSQAGAVMLGLARALVKMRPDLEGTLRDKCYLTRDSRMVERKKYGHKKARKSFQFSKR